MTNRQTRLFSELGEDVTLKDRDEYIQASIMILRGDTFACGAVVSRKCDAEGNIIGHDHDNPILDCCVYDFEFVDGKVTVLTANAIAKAMYAKCDPDGNECICLDEHIDVRRTDDAMTQDRQQITVNGTTCQRKSPKGWFICCKWKDGSTSWEKLSDLKESHPVQVAEFAIQMGVALEPSFNWWVFCVVKKSNAIILLVKCYNIKYLKKTHKYGLSLSKLVDDALAIDGHTDTTLWANAIAKEMNNVRVISDALEGSRGVPHGIQFVKYHMIFDIKIEDFH